MGTGKHPSEVHACMKENQLYYENDEKIQMKCVHASAQENQDGTDAKMGENEPCPCQRTDATEI